MLSGAVLGVRELSGGRAVPASTVPSQGALVSTTYALLTYLMKLVDSSQRFRPVLTGRQWLASSNTSKRCRALRHREGSLLGTGHDERRQPDIHK